MCENLCVCVCVAGRELVISLDFTPACHEKLSEHVFTRLKEGELLPPVCVQSDGAEVYSKCRRWFNPCSVCVCAATDNSSGLSEHSDSTQQLYEALPTASSVTLSLSLLCIYVSRPRSASLSFFIYLLKCDKQHERVFSVSPSATLTCSPDVGG